MFCRFSAFWFWIGSKKCSVSYSWSLVAVAPVSLRTRQNKYSHGDTTRAPLSRIVQTSHPPVPRYLVVLSEKDPGEHSVREKSSQLINIILSDTCCAFVVDETDRSV